ncbi:hypothetical protein [Massilimicrobiota timonensis]|uniref:Protein CR006 P-loop domain-containing protein n=1 Tax=Massilimicrobiota timonensis TaxID=1776392 RepID=A0A1Y4T5E2_9FIRM|nr:hypothetical protein [Massilimicrobiota timonensis]OUQ36432.1 hypothetical protein B5E75_01160 [Massilimicrobiota timonensis]
MKIEFNNLGVIEHGNLEIIENSINVKYGINGTGKSTIAKGIEKSIKGEDLSVLKKYDSDLVPTIQIDKNFSNVIVFNQEYVNQYLFHEDIVNNSFEILINTDEYKLALKRINNLFFDLVNSISSSDIKTIIEELTGFKNSLDFKIKETKKGTTYSVPATTKFAKGKKLSNLSVLITEDAKPYQSLLEANNNFEWHKWFENGIKLLTGKKCPFCLNDLPENFEKICADINNTFKTTALKQNVEVKNVVYKIKKYFDDNTKKEVDNIVNSNDKVSSDEAKLLYSLYVLCEQELNKLNNLSNLSVIQIKEKYDNNILVDFLKENKLSMDFYSHLEKDVFEKINNVNNSIDNLISKDKDIKNITQEFSQKLNFCILNKSQYINDFLRISGIPYEVKIQALGDKNYKTILKPICVEKIISKDDLSYGERNAISLILFSLEAEQNYDLIILDDPVSSFDNNKKFAILYYLFTKDNAVFKNKTVILFTHDFDIIIDLMYKDNFRNINDSCSFVSNQNGIFTDIRIKKDWVCNTLRQWEKKSKNTGLNILLRLVNLRKYLQYSNPKENDAFNIISSLEHLYDTPKKKECGELIDMNEDEINDGISTIMEYINNFDYEDILSKLKSSSNLIKWYKSATSSIDKLQIMRAYLYLNPLKAEDQVFMSFITESYHYENNEMISLDEKRYNIIPNYIIKICDSIIGN